MQKYVFVVMTNARENRDEEYNDWCTNRHLPDMLRIPGFKAAQRFQLAKTQRKDPPFPYKYMVHYEIETDDLGKSIATLNEWSGTDKMPSTTSLHPDRLAYFFEPITKRMTRVD